MLLTDVGLVYLATPYTKYEGGIELAFIHACKLVARMILLGVPVYSPIAHTHPIAIHGNIDPMDHSIWLPANQIMMEKADALVVAMMPGWRESKGVNHEIDFFREAGKPIYYLDPITFIVAE